MRVWLGWDPREAVPYEVAFRSIRKMASVDVHIQGISMSHLKDLGVYTRPTTTVNGRLWDVLSEAPMSTTHAIARFFVPFLQGHRGWAVSADGDVLCRADISDLMLLADARYAVMVVQHQHEPVDRRKMDGQIQTSYARKNWSSVILWNCAHPAHQALTLDVLNTWPGRDLHAFRWLKDAEIGELPIAWNHLVGVCPPNHDAKLVHFTLGTPDMAGYEEGEFADEWRAMAGWPTLQRRYA